jgi:hypothetical protein
MDSSEALVALEQVQATRREVAQKAQCPPYWHVAFGLLMATMVGGQVFSPLYSVAILVLCLGAAVLMARAARRRLGFFVNGYRRGRTRPVALALLAYVEILHFGALWLKLGQHILWAPLAAAALVLPGAIYGSYVWQRAYIAEMSEGPGAITP